MHKSLLLLTFLFFINNLPGQNLVINEIMSSNTDTHTDEDGDFTDWIEIYNPMDAMVNLKGFGLSDDPDSTNKWTFPEVKLFPGQFILIYASDKNRRQWENYFWETIIDVGDAPPDDRRDVGVPVSFVLDKLLQGVELFRLNVKQ